MWTGGATDSNGGDDDATDPSLRYRQMVLPSFAPSRERHMLLLRPKSHVRLPDSLLTSLPVLQKNVLQRHILQTRAWLTDAVHRLQDTFAAAFGPALTGVAPFAAGYARC